MSTQKGQSKQIFSRQKPSFEWRSTNSKPFKVKPIHSFAMKTSGDSNPELSFEAFKAGRSQLKQPLPTSPASKPVDSDRVVWDSGSELEMRSSYYGVKNNDKNHEMQPQSHQTQVRRPLSENSNDHSSNEGNSSCNMEIKTLEIPKGLLKRIDPSFRAENMGKPVEEGDERFLEDQLQLMESNGSCLNDAVDSAEAGMQLDQGGDVSLPPC